MKKVLFLLLVLIMGTNIGYASSGMCGDNVSWVLAYGVLSIQGTGAMTNYASSSKVPWHYQCTSIKTITISSGVTSIGNFAFYGCENLTSITIANDVTSIGNQALSHCNSLTSVTLPNGIISIGDNAFYHCNSLTSVTLPNSITSIGRNAFSDCESLSSIRCYAILPPTIDDGAFDISVCKKAKLRVPSQNMLAYINANQWKKFIQILPIEPNAVNAGSFVGFQATEENTMGDQIYSKALIQNKNNVVLEETNTTDHTYNINLVNGGKGSFTMGGVTFSYTHSLAGKTAYQTYNTYIQPFGSNREISIPTRNGEVVDIILDAACSGAAVTVDGTSKSFKVGHNILTAKGSNITVKYNSDASVSGRPAISAIKSLSYTTDDIPVREAIIVRLDPQSVSSWSEVRLWAWTSDGNLFDAWPGVVVNKDETGWYSYTFDISVPSVNIIWTNGTDQTAEITNISETTCFTLNGSYGSDITTSIVDCPTYEAQPSQFIGFEATSNNKMGIQIYLQGLIQDTHNITLIETDATKHKYDIKLTNGGEGTFLMGGITFSYTDSEAGKTAYKTYDMYIQPNGFDREIRIPTYSGQPFKIILVEGCDEILIDGVSTNLVAGDNLVIASKDGTTINNPSSRPKITGILPIGGSQDINVVHEDQESFAPRKVMIDGQILILRGDKTYTLQGQEVK